MKLDKMLTPPVKASLIVFWAFSAFGASNSIWQQVDDSWSGSFTNAAHWKNGVVPDYVDGTTYFAQYDGAITGAIAYPEGVYTNAAGTRLNYAVGDDITFDGSETELFKSTGVYGMYPLRLSIEGTWFIGVDGFNPGTASMTDFWAVLSNFTVRTTMSADRLSLDATGFFHYPKETFTLFGNTTSTATKEGVVTLKPGSRFKATKFGLAGKTFKHNQLVLDGSTLETGSLSVGRTGAVSEMTTFLATNGATVVASGDMILSGDSGGAVRTVFDRATVSAATLTAGGTGVQTNELTMANSTVDVAGAFTCNSAIARLLAIDRSDVTIGGTWSLAGETKLWNSSVNYAGTLDLSGAGSRLEIVGSALTNLTTTGTYTYLGGTSASATSTVYIADSDIRHYRQILSRYADVTITNSTIRLVAAAATAEFGAQYGADVRVFDSTLTCGILQAGVAGAAGHVPRFSFVRSSVTGNASDSFIGGANYDGLITLSDSTWLSASLYMGGPKTKADSTTAKSTGRLVLLGSSVYNPGTNLRVGSAICGCGEVLVADDATFNVPGANFSLGWYGHGSVIVTNNGALVSSGVIKLATEASDDAAESVLRMEGGETRGTDVTVAVAAGRKARVVLNGGAMKVSSIVGGAGVSALEADGGKVVPTAKSANLIGGLGSATLGEKGLTIESDFDVTIPQDFTDKADAEGRLVLSGKGVKTLSGTESDYTTLEVNGGKVVFAEGVPTPKNLVLTNGNAVALSGAATFENLVLGTATSVGVLEVTPETTITVTGDLDIANLQLALDGDFPIDTSYSLFSCPNGVSDATMEALTAAFVKSGLAAGKACSFEKVSGEGGAVTLKMSIVKADPLVIHVGEGESETHATNIIYNASQTLEAIVEEDAALTLSGKVGYGVLEKSGAGTLYLTGLEKVFYPGLTLLEGVISVSDLYQLGDDHVQNVAGPRLCGGKLEVTGEGTAEFDRPWSIEGTETTSLVEIDAKTDVKMPMPAVTQGAFRKRGPGRLVFEASENGAKLNFTTTGNGKNPNEEMTGYTGFTVQEGEMVFRGARPGVTNTLACNLNVGVPGKSGSVQPGLVVDNMDLSFGNNLLNFGTYITNDTHKTNGDLLGVANTFVTDPYLVVTNGAVLRCGDLKSLGDGCWYRTCSGKFHCLVDDASICTTGYFYPSASVGNPVNFPRESKEKIHARIEVRNNGGIRAYEVYSYGNYAIDFDHAFLGGNSLHSRVPTTVNFATNDQTSNWSFVSSEFCVSRVHRSPARYQCTPCQRFLFEDTLWSCGDNDLLVGATNVNMNIFVRGRGLRFAPYEGRTYTVRRKIRGDGGVVMDGPGTLVFGRSQYLNVENPDSGETAYDPCTVAYTGNTEVNGGVIDFGGFSLTNMTFTGAGGRIENATLVNTTIANTNLTFAADVAFGSRTRVDFGNLDVADGDVVTVGHYEGTAPDVTLWRGRNFKTRGLKATFAAEGGDIVATVKVPGLMLIVR